MLKTFPLAALLLGVTLAFAGCSGDGDSPRHHDRDREAMGPPVAAKPVMHGQETFFGGKLLVEASLGQGFHHSGPNGEDRGSGEGSGGGGGGGHHGHRGGGGSGGAPGGGGGGYLGGDGSGAARGMGESNLPPVNLGLHLTNHSDALIEVSFEGCDSSLGNFVVTPEKIVIPAGQGVDTDPMRSLLGVTSDEIPIEMSLRVGGKVEKKTLTLHLDQPPSIMSEAPPSPAPNP